MDIFIQASQFLLSLSLLIVLHEFGHFIPARLFGTRVEKFYLFFDYKWSLFKKKIGDTEWGVGWIPLGGYVKISGMIDESMDKEQMAGPAQPWEFRSKPAWQRLIIMLGGVTVNLVLGFFIYAMILWVYGEKRLPMESLQDGIMVNSPLGAEIGLENGDRIVSINNKKPYYFSEYIEEAFYADEIIVDRGGELVELSLPENLVGQVVDGPRASLFSPRIPLFIGAVPDTSINVGVFNKNDRILGINGVETRYFDQAQEELRNNADKVVPVALLRDSARMNVQARVSKEGLLQIATKGLSYKEMEHIGLYDVETYRYSFLKSFPAGWNKTKSKLTSYVRQLGLLADVKSGAWKGIGGFGSIGSLFESEWDWYSFWSITALLSLILAVMNLLPIPALDGGHVMFLLYEMVTGREPNQRFLEFAQLVGFFFLIALLLLANGNDVYRFFFK